VCRHNVQEELLLDVGFFLQTSSSSGPCVFILFD
jgi:hypothetical protein